MPKRFNDKKKFSEDIYPAIGLITKFFEGNRREHGFLFITRAWFEL